MVEILKTDVFTKWFDGLKDTHARLRILARIDRLSGGNLGDVKSVGNGISELKIDYGPGYRIYMKKRNNQLVLLINGGTKRRQSADIEKAKQILRDIKEDDNA